MRTFKLFNETFDDLVFENRNKNYGAYYLRKAQDAFMVRGMMFSMGFLLLFIFGPRLLASWGGDKEVIFEEKGHLVILSDLPIVPPVETPPPPKEADIPPKQNTIKFVEPDVVVDTRIEELPPMNIDISKNVISNTTTAGVENGMDVSLIPDVPTQPAVVDVPVPTETTKDPGPSIVDFSTEKPAYPEGMNALMKFLGGNIKYPQIAKETGIEGKVIVQFVVTKEGSIEMVKVLRGIGGGCDEEALRVVKLMKKWLPGKNNGKPVNVRFTLPISFKLE
jgi:periplasmic protein TonB